jgi:hypothetical protein
MGRSQLIAWDDPVAAAGLAAEMSGLEAMEAIADGRLPPPPMALLGMQPLDLHGDPAAVSLCRGRRAGPGSVPLPEWPPPPTPSPRSAPPPSGRRWRWRG